MNFLRTNKMMHCVATGKDISYNSSDINCDVNHDEHIRGSTVNLSLSFHNVHNGNQ